VKTPPISLSDARAARPLAALAAPRHPHLFVVAAAVSGLGIAATLAIARSTGAELSSLTRDVVAATDTHLYTGMLSTLGIMLWSATSALCLLAGSVLGRCAGARGGSRFLLVAGCLTGALAFDDAFLFHERIAPAHLHLPELVVNGLYAASVFGFLLGFRRQILASEYLLLGIALACLAASMSLDIVLPTSNLETFVEDSFKFSGIVFWLSYFRCAAAELLGEALRQRGALREVLHGARPDAIAA